MAIWKPFFLVLVSWKLLFSEVSECLEEVVQYILLNLKEFLYFDNIDSILI